LQILQFTEYLMCFFSVSHFLHASLLPVAVECSPWCAEKVILLTCCICVSLFHRTC